MLGNAEWLVDTDTTPPEPNWEALADAIYYAEGGSNTKHPYGILQKYKTTTPRQASINTAKHAYKDWTGDVPYLQFLANRYAPVGVANDPTNLNKNWYGNVKKIYMKQNKDIPWWLQEQGGK